jgi:colanic acid biosynthesis glycosyl transferase WcaI
MYLPENLDGKKRMLQEASFGLSTLRYWLPRMFRRYDAIVSVYPSLQTGFAPLLYKLFHPKTAWIFHVQDLQVDAAKDLGMVKAGGLLGLLEKIEITFFRRATKTSSISAGMINKIVAKGIPREHILFFPNWSEIGHLQPLQARREELKRRFGVPAGKTLLLYSGNMGEKQGLEDMVAAAKLLQDQGRTDLHFLLVGEGSSKRRIMKLAQDLQLDNLQFGDLVPFEDLPLLLNAADLHLILQKKGATDLVMPSKLTNILAVGGVSVVASEADSTLRQVIEQYNMGYTADPEDVDALAALIAEASAQNNQGKSAHARDYAEKFLDKEVILRNFERNLLELSGQRPTA